VIVPSPAKRKWQHCIAFAVLSLVCWSAPACSSAIAPPVAEHDTDSAGKLQAVTLAHTALAAELAAAPHEDLLHCQNAAGDCLISVAERRDELVRRYYINACRDPAPEKQAPCLARELEQRADRTNLASYYETENWCSRKLLECTTSLANDAAHQVVRQRVQERRRQVTVAPSSVAAASAPELARERLAFVRATLPPPAQEACSGMASADCESTLKGPRSDFEAELLKAPASYDAARALALFAAIYQAEADCSTPELSCLTSAVSQYGGTLGSEKLMQQNLALLSKAQQLKATIDPDAGAQCDADAVLKYQPRIVTIYRNYVHNPGALPLMQLLATFVGLHQEQLSCLQRLSKLPKH